MKKILLITILFLATLCSYSQVFTIQKDDCNINFVNASSLKVWYSYDLYEGVINYNPANDVKQFIVADNNRTNTFTITQYSNAFISLAIIT